MPLFMVDRAIETAYIVAGIEQSESLEPSSVRDHLSASDVGPADFALIPTAEITLLTRTHAVDPEFGVSTVESGAIAMRAPVRPDGIEDASILLYNVSGTAELLARATIWPFYGIRASAWVTEADGSSTITIVDGVDALEPVEAGFNEDLVRAWYILTEQPVVTHLLAIPLQASQEEIDAVRMTLTAAAAAGYTNRREVRKTIQADSSMEGDRLVDFLAGIRNTLDDSSRMAAYSLIARGTGGTRFPLLRDIPWWKPASELSEADSDS